MEVCVESKRMSADGAKGVGIDWEACLGIREHDKWRKSFFFITPERELCDAHSRLIFRIAFRIFPVNVEKFEEKTSSILGDLVFVSEK